MIYDAVSTPSEWVVFLDNLTESMNAHASRMRMIDNRETNYNLFAGTGHDDAYDQLYADYFHQVDLWNSVINRAKPGQIFNSDEDIPIKNFQKSEIYNDFYRNYDMQYGLGSNIIKTKQSIARIGVHRSHSQGKFTQRESLLLRELMPHLMRAFKLGTHIESLQCQLNEIHEALYLSPSPLILIDENQKVAFTNKRAEELLCKENGLFVRSNRLITASTKEQKILNQLLEQSVLTGAHKGQGSGGSMRLTDKKGNNRFNLLVTPYPDRTVNELGLNHRICAAVFIHDTQQVRKISAERLKSLYALTRSEIRLAEAIPEGLTPAEAAEKIGVSVNTTRSQLRSLFGKTDTQRQAELVRLLIGITD